MDRAETNAIDARLALALPGFTIERVAQIDSTNSELMRRARAGGAQPTLLLAEQQSAGRGRLGRSWHSAATGSALTFSIGLPLTPPDWSGLSLAVGVGVAQSLHPDLRLKWPNDVWWQSRKLAGILVETVNWNAPGRPRYAVIGVGINVRQPEATGLATPPAWLTELIPDIDAGQTLERVAPALVQSLLAFEASGFAPWQQAFNQLDAFKGLPVSLGDGTQAIAHGVDASGALQLESANGHRSVCSAEVSLRGVPV